jgi:hypothetical protein
VTVTAWATGHAYLMTPVVISAATAEDVAQILARANRQDR